MAPDRAVRLTRHAGRADEPRPHPPVPGKLDRGIASAVQILQDHGIETYESCEGGPGHAYTEPTICFHGADAAGWRALATCFSYYLPVLALQRVWYVQNGNEPTGPKWELRFRRRMR
jgi:hypothetical protein